MALAALGDQSRQERLDTVDRAPQIDIDHEAPVVVAGLDDRTGVGDAGVVEHDVDLAEHAKRLVGQVLDVVELAHVAHDTVRVDPVRAQGRDRIVQRGLIDVGEHRPWRRGAANSRAVAKPMPLAPPVMTAARPS